MTTSTSAPGPRPTLRWILIFGGAAVAAVAVAFAVGGGDPRGPLLLHWRIDGEPVRSQLQEVPPGAELSLEIENADGPRWVYVVGFNRVQGTVALFPSPQLRTDITLPLPTGRTMLPGTFEERRLSWRTPVDEGPHRVFVVAAPEPLPELEALLARSRQASNRVFPDRSMVVVSPREEDGGEAAVPDRGRLHHPLLEAAAGTAATLSLADGTGQGTEVVDSNGTTCRVAVLELLNRTR